MDHKILSAIPIQLNNTNDKIKWIEFNLKKYQPHILVTPQEFFGGAVMMPHERDFEFEKLFPILSKMAKKFAAGLVIGVQQKDPGNINRSAIWFINEKGEFQGRLLKFAIPRYDHIKTSGFGQVTPEIDIENRFKVFKIHNLFVSAIFCWEVYSNILWTGLSILKPDLIFNMIKFGPNAWPIIKTINYQKVVKGFGYGRWAEEDDGGWISRLKMANIWQIKCPIINATNSWNLNPRSMPICGCISNLDGQAQDDHWYPRKEDKFHAIPEKIIISIVDEQRVRGVRKNKFAYADAVGEFPPFCIGKYTMHLKINRIEDRLLNRGLHKQGRVKSNIKTLFPNINGGY
jgi:hypothetical protein